MYVLLMRISCRPLLVHGWHGALVGLTYDRLLLSLILVRQR